jgi:hypothetical protein
MWTKQHSWRLADTIVSQRRDSINVKGLGRMKRFWQGEAQLTMVFALGPCLRGDRKKPRLEGRTIAEDLRNRMWVVKPGSSNHATCPLADSVRVLVGPLHTNGSFPVCALNHSLAGMDRLWFELARI